MSSRRIDFAANLAALAAGALLSLMVHLNGEAARQGGALFSSWLAHGTGTLAALLAVPLWWKAIQRSDGPRPSIPLWAYLGGFAGAAWLERRQARPHAQASGAHAAVPMRGVS